MLLGKPTIRFFHSDENHEEESNIASADRPVPVQSIRVSARVSKGRPAVTWTDESQTPAYPGLAAVDAETAEPLPYHEAMDSPQVNEWVAAMDEQLASLKKNERELT